MTYFVTLMREINTVAATRCRVELRNKQQTFNSEFCLITLSLQRFFYLFSERKKLVSCGMDKGNGNSSTDVPTLEHRNSKKEIRLRNKLGKSEHRIR